ncbi:MAG: glycosyltransferase family 4 protein [Bacteroidales bacterium]|nr:glycosyltransferase family 4 protein [Bacteroidales bacterium]
MNVIFLTMVNLQDIAERGIYTDLMRKFRNEGHRVTIVSPRERRLGEHTNLNEVDGVQILGVRTLNLQKTNVIEKGLGQVLVESQFKRAIKKHLCSTKVDLILYSTPPITLMGVVKYLKKKNPQAKTYLLLKDIFPQNAVDLGMISKSGVKGLLYKYFRKKEKQLYQCSDFIGCMSPANVQYVIDHNPEVMPQKVELAPNSYEPVEPIKLSDEDRYALREKYHLPTDRPIFIYGGNLGKPQGIPFLIRCLDANANRQDCHFLVVGNGTEYGRMKAWYDEKNPQSISLFASLPKEDYDQLVRVCDVGLVFLDYRFTIPNYPSRLLPYLMEKKPIIAATDPNCDMGTIAEANGYGFWCPSNDVNAFTASIDRMLHANMVEMGEVGYQYYTGNYTADHTYKAIINHFR